VARAYEVLSDPISGPATTGSARPGSAVTAAAATGGRPLRRWARRHLRRVLRWWRGPVRRWRRPAGPAGPPRGQDIEVVVDLTFEQAVFGDQVPSRCAAAACDDCGGPGPARAPSPSPAPSAAAGGRCAGPPERARPDGHHEPVPRCGGIGEVIVTPCTTCRGEGRITVDKTYQVDVPAGVDTGSHPAPHRARCGRAARRPPGDLYVHLRVAPRALPREDDDLVTEVPSRSPRRRSAPASPSTLDGDEELSIPPGTQPGREFVLRGGACPASGSRPWRPAGHGGGRGAHQADRRSESELLASTPRVAARRSARRQGLFSKHQVGVLVSGRDRGGTGRPAPGAERPVRGSRTRGRVVTQRGRTGRRHGLTR
jgi:hypothetical protein